MLWYEERKQVDKMESKMNGYTVIDMHKPQLCVMPKQLDVKNKVSR